jgi:hypothetical protein
MLIKLIILIPSVLSIALCTYLLAGIALYVRALYQSVPVIEPTRRGVVPASSATAIAPVEIEPLPAT